MIYKDNKTYNHGDTCTDENGVRYIASCTMLAMQGISPNKYTIGNFWIEEEKESSPEYIDGYEIVSVTENEDVSNWKKFFRHFGY